MASKKSQEPSCTIDRKRRTIYVCGEITPEMSSKFRRYFRSLDEDKETITVEINSGGGAMEAGLMMSDTILESKSDVVTRVTGEAASMAAVLLVCGDIREALPSSTIMIHQGSFWISSVPHKMLEREVREMHRLQALVWKYLDERTEKAAGFWEDYCGQQNIYLDRKSATDLGVIDPVLETICE